MPLMRNGDLGDLIAREDGPLPLPLIRRLALQLCDALDYAHARGIVHRDMKPANVLLDERGNGLLTDFGIALPECRAPDDGRPGDRHAPSIWRRTINGTADARSICTRWA